MLDRVENKGRLEGELKGKQETAINLHNMGMDNDFIAKAVNVSIDLVKQWLTPGDYPIICVNLLRGVE